MTKRSQERLSDFKNRKNFGLIFQPLVPWMAVRWLRLRQRQASWALLFCLSVFVLPWGKKISFLARGSIWMEKVRKTYFIHFFSRFVTVCKMIYQVLLAYRSSFEECNLKSRWQEWNEFQVYPIRTCQYLLPTLTHSYMISWKIIGIRFAEEQTDLNKS